MNTEFDAKQPPEAREPIRALTLKVFGVGGAGGNAVDYMARQDFTGVHFMAFNTDGRALSRLGVRDRMVLGMASTRGLGAGGDPEVGRAAAEEDAEKLREHCAGADVICIVAGMGGGTGTGAAPVLARIARESGALVLGVVTTPFEYEGVRRSHQAILGLGDLKATADGVICLPNSRVEKMTDENTRFEETFRISNEYLTQGVRGIWRLLSQTGMVNVDFNDLAAVLRGRHDECSLALVEASGENRVTEILDKFSTNPFLEEGIVLSEAEAVLVSIAAGTDLKSVEVRKVMSQISRQCGDARIFMGVALQESLAGKCSITLVASRKPNVPQRKSSLAYGECDESVDEGAMLDSKEPSRPPSRRLPPPPKLSPEKMKELLESQEAGKKGKLKNRSAQLPLNLETVSKGRFDSVGPTLDGGEDLDVPTYIRRGMSLNP